MELLRVENLSKTYGKGEAAVRALRDVSFSMERGEFAAVVGESGSGKSTLLNCIGGLDAPTGGKVYLDGEDLFSMTENKRTIFRRQNIGFIFQSFHLIEELDVEQNIIFPLLLDYRKPKKGQVEELLELLGLTERRHHLPGQLSGGQQQRVALARTLAQNPQIILADEPVASLDPVTARQVMDDFQRINRDMNITVIINIHHVELALQYASRVIGIREGKIVYDGPSSQVTQQILDGIYQGKEEAAV